MRETPETDSDQTYLAIGMVAGRNDPGYGNTAGRLGNSQPSPIGTMGKVQRLDRGGLAHAGLRYSPSASESCCGVRNNGSLRLNLTQHGETHQVNFYTVTCLGLE